MTDCTECKYFVLCDLAKLAFYKITGTPCKEFKTAEEKNESDGVSND